LRKSQIRRDYLFYHLGRNGTGRWQLAVITTSILRPDTANAIDKAVGEFGGIDIPVNNASAIKPLHHHSEQNDFDLMYIRVHWNFYEPRLYPHTHLKSYQRIFRAMSPPINMDMKWFTHARNGVMAYTISKYIIWA